MKSILKYFVLAVLVLSCPAVIRAQDTDKASKKDISEQKQWEKENRKLEREQEKENMIALTRFMIESHRFVLEADFLSDKYGSRVPVSPTINFIKIDSTDCTLQLGSAFTVGYNGVGGTTLDGRVIRYEYNKTGKKKTNYQIRMTIMTAVATYDVFLNSTQDGYADANIRGNWSGQLNYHGKLVPLNMSKVFKGMPSF
jgi:hypothetical protein